jgi:hypothetical protein
MAVAQLLISAVHLEEQRSTFLNAAWVFWKSYARVIKELPWSKELEPRSVRHVLAWLLLEGPSYLSKDQSQLLENIVLEHLSNPPATINDLTSGIEKTLTANER